MLFVLTFVISAFFLSVSGEKVLHGDDNIIQRSRREITVAIAPVVQQVRRQVATKSDELVLQTFLRYVWAIIKLVVRTIRNHIGD